MDYIIIALLLAAIILLIVLIAQRGKQTDSQNLISQNIKEMGQMISSNQQSLGKAQTDGVLASLTQMENRLLTIEKTTDNRLSEIRQTVTRHLNSISEENSKKLSEINNAVNQKLQESMSNSFKLVSERLEAVYKGLGEMQTVAASVGDLKKVLTNVKTRGILGEYQLGAILSEILTKEQYEENVATIPNSRNHVEFAIKLPGDERAVYLPIDSKFPADTYEHLQSAYESGNADEVTAAKKALVQRIKGEAKDIKEKYIMPPYTTGFGIMFLPFESLYCEAVNMGLLEILQREYNITIAGPSTMAAMLNALQMGFKTLSVQKKSAEVWNILGGVKSEFEKFSSTLEATQSKLTSAQKELDSLIGVRTRAIVKKLKDVESTDNLVLDTE